MSPETLLPPPSVARLSPRQGLAALQALRHGMGGILPVLEMVRAELGDLFQITLPGFRPVFVAQPAAIRQVLVTQREAFLWRPEQDPVARLLRRGLLVTDGAEHDNLHAIMAPSSQRQHFVPHADRIVHAVDRVLDTWPREGVLDMLTEMRKIALLVFERLYFSHDMAPELEGLWRPILDALDYIGPGFWIVLGARRPPTSLRRLDAHLLELIRRRRAAVHPPDDLLTHLVQHLQEDDLVRDQMITMLIAGHDTSTAGLAWTLYLLGKHPVWRQRVQEEIRSVLGTTPPTPEVLRSLPGLDQVVKESLRLFPPIHVGNRFAAHAVELAGYEIPAGTRVMVSFYLVQRHPDAWEEPAAFRPERWRPDFRPLPFTYLPFGGGPRNCIGGTFAHVEMRLVLARIFQRFTLGEVLHPVAPHMGATLEPRPSVSLSVKVCP